MTQKITPEAIAQTEFFNTLDPILQKITLHKRNREEIEHGVNVAKNLGFEKWNQITATRYTNRMIVKEILEQSSKLTYIETL